MNDSLSPATPVATPLDVGELQRTLLELEQRVQVLENTVAAIPDAKQLEERVTDRVVTRLPKAPSEPEPAAEPSFRDIALPIPSARTMTTVMQSSWMIWDLVADARTMFWMLMDRRYTKAWMTRLLALVLLGLIGTTGLWVPLSGIAIVGYWVDKLVVVVLTLALGVVLSRETRRYREWRGVRA